MIKSAVAIDSLISALSNEDNLSRWKAVVALGSIGNKRAIKPLVTALRDKNRSVRNSAADALSGLDWKPMNKSEQVALLFATQKWDELASRGARVVTPLINALRDDDWEVRWGAAKALGKIGDTRAIHPLLSALKYEDEFTITRSSATTRALVKIDPSWRTSESAKNAVDEFITALSNDNIHYRRKAALVLGVIGDPSAIEPLKVLSSRDSEQNVRNIASHALQMINK